MSKKSVILPLLWIFFSLFIVGTFVGRKKSRDEERNSIYKNLDIVLDSGTLHIVYRCLNDNPRKDSLFSWNINLNQLNSTQYTKSLLYNNNKFSTNHIELKDWEQIIVGFIGGIPTGITIKETIEVIQKKSSKTFLRKFRNLLLRVVAIVSGYQLGIEVGKRSEYKCNSDRILEYLDDPKVWKEIEKIYFWTRLFKAKERKIEEHRNKMKDLDFLCEEYYLMKFHTSKDTSVKKYLELVKHKLTDVSALNMTFWQMRNSTISDTIMEKYHNKEFLLNYCKGFYEFWRTLYDSFDIINLWPIEKELIKRAEISDFDPNSQDFLTIIRLANRKLQTYHDYNDKMKNLEKTNDLREGIIRSEVESLLGSPLESKIEGIKSPWIIEVWYYKALAIIFENGAVKKIIRATPKEELK